MKMDRLVRRGMRTQKPSKQENQTRQRRGQLRREEKYISGRNKRQHMEQQMQELETFNSQQYKKILQKCQSVTTEKNLNQDYE